LQWAMTQTNLGIALRSLGGREGDTAQLEDAVSAHRAALQVFSREGVPVQWAMTQNNLGFALTTLGDRDNRINLFEQAIPKFMLETRL